MSKKIKVLMATGGTGGHVYPAIALAQQIMSEFPDSEILFVGGDLSTNRYFDRTTFAYQTVRCGSFIRKSPIAIGKACFNIGKGMWQSRAIIKKFKPDVVVGFGSYFSFPPLIAAKVLGVPLILHEANSIPGKVNRLLAPWADVIGVHFPETIHLVKGNAVEVGMPLRKGFQRCDIPMAEARKYFGLSPNVTTLLVFGGSQGANAINMLVSGAIEKFKNLPQPIQVLHFTGDKNLDESLRQLYKEHGVEACVKSFEANMQMAWQAADLVIARSGAGTIAEQLEFEIPGVLIPYPRAAENHQEYNADFMVTRVGGAVKLNEKGLVVNRLMECLTEFLKDDRAMLVAMKQAMYNYKRKARKRDLYALVFETVGRNVR